MTEKCHAFSAPQTQQTKLQTWKMQDKEKVRSHSAILFYNTLKSLCVRVEQHLQWTLGINHKKYKPGKAVIVLDVVAVELKRCKPEITIFTESPFIYTSAN